MLHQLAPIKSNNRILYKDQEWHRIPRNPGKWSGKTGLKSCTSTRCHDVINPSQENDFMSQLNAAKRSYFALSLYPISGDNYTCQESCEKLSISAAWIFRGKEEPLSWERSAVPIRAQIPTERWSPLSLGCFQLQVMGSWVLPSPPLPVAFCSRTEKPPPLSVDEANTFHPGEKSPPLITKKKKEEEEKEKCFLHMK